MLSTLVKDECASVASANRVTAELIRLAGRSRPDLPLHEYRPTVLARRIESRMASLSMTDANEYVQRVASDAAELDHLARHLRIKTSAFFRNREVFALLRERVIETVRRSGEERLRAWSAGCSHGEETYSLAHLIGAAGRAAEWSVLGTDVDAGALEAAREGWYPQWALEELNDGEVELLFTSDGADAGGRRQLRMPRCPVEFALHDLLRASQPPDGSRFELVLCRNVLIYWVPDAQQRVQQLLTRALEPGGFLCLGEAETLSRAVVDQYRVVDARARLFQKI